MTDRMTSVRLRELIHMRQFIDLEILDEKRRLAELAEIAARDRDAARTGALIRAAAELYGVGVEEILSPDKGNRSVSGARNMAAWLLRQTGLSYPAIGRRLSRDHSTVIASCRRVDGDATVRALAREIFSREVAA